MESFENRKTENQNQVYGIFDFLEYPSGTEKKNYYSLPPLGVLITKNQFLSCCWFIIEIKINKKCRETLNAPAVMDGFRDHNQLKKRRKKRTEKSGG